MRVIVIGAGIAGLSAAWELHCTGHDVSVLERSNRAGGRVSSTELGGVVVELGAQILPARARVIPALARRMGLSVRPAAAPPAIYRHGKTHLFDVDHPGSLFRNGLLPWGSGRAMVGLSRMRRLSVRPTDDLTAWTDLDASQAAIWSHAHFGAAVTHRVLHSAVKAHLLSLDDSGSALVAAVATNRGSAGTATIEGGLEQLPAALASRLDVRFNTLVERVRVVDGRPLVETSTDTLTAERIVLAVPGPQAIDLWTDAPAEEHALMATPYRAGLVVSLGYPSTLPPEALAGASSILMPAESDIASVLVASRSGRGVAHGDALTVVFIGAIAAEEDDAIVERTRAAINDLEPGLGGAATASLITRWPLATPSVPQGHATRVRQYRTQLAADAPIVLAGDYLGFPWSDSAARGGVWAARHITGSLRSTAGGDGTASREQPVSSHPPN